MNGFKILIVDDDTLLRRALGRAARRQGMQCASVNDGSAAIEVVRLWRPDAVLLDVSLPGMDGRDVLVQLRQRCDDDLAVVVICGRDDQLLRRMVLELGADDFVAKPLEPMDALFRRVARLVESRLADRAAEH